MANETKLERSEKNLALQRLAQPVPPPAVGEGDEWRKLESRALHVLEAYDAQEPIPVPSEKLLRLIAAFRKAMENDWVSISESLPSPSTQVLGWLYLHKNPSASGPAIAEYSGCETNDPYDTEEIDFGLRRTIGCWWVNGMYYEAGHVTHWRPLPAPPAARAGIAKGE